MKILFLDSPSYGKEDICEAYTALGYEVIFFNHPMLYEYNNREFNLYFDELISSDSYQFVFSFNFFPAISAGCQRNHLKYVSFVYDSPQVALYSYTIINPCNYVFLFDKTLFYSLKNEGIETVYYLPLCVNEKRLRALPNPSDADITRYSSDVSFVGSLYTEEHNLYDRMQTISEFTRGYLEGIMNAQRKVNGYFFIQELLTPEVLSDMKQAVPYLTRPDGTESDAYIYANYFIARKLTFLERIDLLKNVSEHYQTKLFTFNQTPFLPECQNVGKVDYLNEMPQVFRHSKINLNITLRSIYSGIPLRAFDIMGSGGFLLSNYQEDFLDYFTPGEDFDYYDGVDDLLAKIDYYLSHEKERRQIAENAAHKVLTEHTYENRIQFMLKTAGLR